MYSHGLKWMSRALVLACLAASPLALMAQDAPQPAKPAAKTAFPENAPSKWDIFAGYSYLAPKGTVNTPMGQGVAPVPLSYKSDTAGFILSAARYFNDYVGGQVEMSTHETFRNSSSTNNAITSLGAGLIFRYPSNEVTPFFHALLNLDNVSGPNGPGIDHLYTWGEGVTGGGGMDYETPLFNHHLAIRLFQADYQYMHVNFGTHPRQGGRANINAARLSAGVVFHIGSIAPPPQLTVACSANPTAVFPGEPVNLTSTVGSQDPKQNVVYSWSGDGVKGNGANATVDTTNLTPGQHTVKCDAKEGKAGREGLKPWQVANEGTATFTVKEYEPPTISCSANPTSVKPGENSTITCNGVSPQNRPLTYAYTATGGTVSGTGNTATFSSTGVTPGPVTVSGTVTDDKGHTATAQTTVTVETPPLPPGPSQEQLRLEARLALHSVFFPTAKPTAKDLMGGLLPSQRETLTTLATDFKEYLQYKPDAHLILTGHADVRGSAELNQKLSERRVAAVKQFLVEQGISEGVIDTTAVGKEQQLSADEVKDLIDKNSTLSDAERARVMRRMNVIVLAQNRRVDISLSTTGQQSVRQFPFNAQDALTLLQEKASKSTKATKSTTTRKRPRVKK